MVGKSLLGGLESELGELRQRGDEEKARAAFNAPDEELTAVQSIDSQRSGWLGPDAELPALERPLREWSPLQKAIFADVGEGEGHTIVQARAGTGKTSTIIQALRHVPRGESTTLVAFNKSIARELEQQTPAGVTVKTMHALGFGALRRQFGQLKVEEGKSRRMLTGVFTNRTNKQKRAACRLASHAKALLWPTAKEREQALGQMLTLLDRYWIADFDTDAEYEQVAEMGLWLLSEGLDVEKQNKEIDFDDMCWLPAMHNLSLYRSDRLFVDEAQDLSPCQHWLVVRSVSRTGRLCAIGDDRQAIYQFRGADENSMAVLGSQFHAKWLPLSITYRCPKNVVALVRAIVPDFEAAPNAPDGLVADATVDQMIEGAQPGDFILSRANAPLLGHCLALLRRGVRATVLGRNIGKSLASLVEKSQQATVEGLCAYVRAWCEREQERALRRDPEADVGHFSDRRDCVLAITEDAGSIGEVLDRAERLFSDGDPLDCVTLATAHKAKGLERERVWLLRDTFLKRRLRAEENIFYVAATRAQRELRMVRGPKS